jgi:hypothetical protein
VALLAGLPHALVALTGWAMGVAGAYGLLSWGSSALEIVLGVVLVVSTAAAMAVAWRRGWPRWSASWFVYVFAVVALPLGIALARWELPLGSWQLGVLLPGGYARLVVPFLLAMMVVVVGLRNRLKALLMVVPLVLLLWEPALGFTWYPVRTLVALLAWVTAAMTAILIARAGSVRKGVWMVLGLSVLVGVTYTTARTMYARFPDDAPAHYHVPPTALDWWNLLAPGVLASAVLILEPLLMRRLSVLGRRGGRMGRRGLRLSLAGLVLLLAADLTASWWTPSGLAVVRLVGGYEAASSLWFTLPAALGGLLSLAGAGILAAAGRGGWMRHEMARLLLVFVLTVVPIAVALPLTSGFWDLRTFPRIWGYVVGVPWLGAGIWLVTRRCGGWASRAAV